MRQVFRLYSTRNRTAFDPTYDINVRLPDDEDPDPFTKTEIEKILTPPDNTHLENARVRYCGPNQCRHTFIRQMLSLGVVPLHWISQHVGHATIDMIQRRYGKWIRTDGQYVPEMIEKLLDL